MVATSPALVSECPVEAAAPSTPGAARALPRTLDHVDVDRLFAEIERRLSIDRSPPNLRLAALIELLYGSGLRATELVSLPRHLVRREQPYLILRGKGGRERLVPVSERARAAVAENVTQDVLTARIIACHLLQVAFTRLLSVRRERVVERAACGCRQDSNRHEGNQ